MARKRPVGSAAADSATPTTHGEEMAATDAPNADAPAEETQPAVAPAQDGDQAQDAPAAAEASTEAQGAPAAPAPVEHRPDVVTHPDPDLVDKIDGIWVRSVKPSFRRIGMRFTREGHGIALDALTEEELEILENEPQLKVERMTFTDERLSK